MQKNIFLLGLDKKLLNLLSKILSKGMGEDVSVYQSLDALEGIDPKSPTLIVADTESLGEQTISRIEGLKKRHPEVVVLLIVSQETKELALGAIEAWANDYVVKPYTTEELVACIKVNLSRQELFLETMYLRGEVSRKYAFENIITKSPKMLKLFNMIAVVAQTDSTVLIQGETGTGKELVARSIHFNSPRRNNRFVVVNCGSLPETLLESELFGHEKGAFTGATYQRIGKFEFAHRGTLFLDEIGDVSPAMQLKLLRVLQEKEFERVGGNHTLKTDVRVIAATNKNLDELVEKGIFREDLYYRINVVKMELPPLRDRREDIPLLTSHFLNRFRVANHKDIKELSPEVLGELISYDWPGNVRELANVIERAVIIVQGDRIEEIDLPSRRFAYREGNNGLLVNIHGLETWPKVKREVMEAVEKEYLKRLLSRFHGSIKQTAHHARLTPRSIHLKMTKHGIKKEEFKQKE